MHSSHRFLTLALLMMSYGFACQAQNTVPRHGASPEVTARARPAPHRAHRETHAAKSDAALGPEAIETNQIPSTRRWRTPSIGQTDTWISLGKVDPRGRWVFFCQSPGNIEKSDFSSAMRGARSVFPDRTFVPHFARVDAEAAPVEALLAASPNGRYAVLSRNQKPELLDVETGAVLDLSSRDIDLRSDVFTGDLRSIAFSPGSDRVAFIVHEKQPRITILNLRDSTEVEVVPVSGTVWRIAFDASGAYVVLQEVPEDSNHNGKVSWPYAERKWFDTRCRAKIPAYAAFSPTGDVAQTSIAPVSGGKARWVPGFITGLGSGIVVKSSDGVLSTINGSRVGAFGSNGCNAEVVAIAPEHQRMLVGCKDPSGRAQLEMDTVSSSQKLDLDVPNSSVDRLVPETTPFTAVYSGARSALVDLASARVFPLEDRDQVLVQGRAGAILRRGSKIIAFVPSTSHSEPILDKVPSGVRLVFGDGVVVIGDVVVSAALGAVVGRLTRPVLAVDSNGCGLTSLANATNEAFARGPLSWVCPGD